jgi:hypothetical protein
LLRSTVTGPFVEAIRDNETGTLRVCVSEGGLFGDRLAAGVNRIVPILGIINPVWEESPVLEVQSVGLVVRNDGQLVARGDIEPWFVFVGDVDLLSGLDYLGKYRLAGSSTHTSILGGWVLVCRSTDLNIEIGHRLYHMPLYRF